jgi:predicted nucleic acid-binding protein
MEWLKGREPAAGLFLAMIEDAFAGNVALSMSRMNYGEVIYSIRKDVEAHLRESALKAFLQIPIYFYSVDDLLVDEAAALKAVHKISYADAFAAALSMRLDLLVVTGDPEFLKLKAIGVKLHWMGA